MRVLYDHQAFSLQDYGGISRIFTELILGLKSQGIDVNLPLLYSNNVHLKEAGMKPDVLLQNINVKKRGLIYAANDLYNTYEIGKGNFDIYHPTYYNPDLIKYAKNKPLVATYHDMINEKFSGVYKELQSDKSIISQKKRLIEKANGIIAVSENTKKDLIEIYGISPSKIKVIYLGNSFSANTDSSLPLVKNPYLLFVGNRGLYKNFIPLLTAIAPLLISNDISLVCAGGKIFDSTEQDHMESLSLTNKVQQVAINDVSLANLYSNAISFIFPSLYEGFGIPILEAFSCNCPCVLSNRGSLPEVAGDAAIFFEPDDLHSMFEAVKKVIEDQSLRNKMVQRGKERLKRYSWSKHVQDTIQLYNEIIA